MYHDVRTYVCRHRERGERERERERERKQASKREREKGREERKKAREKDRRKRDRVGMGADNEGTRAQSLGGLVLFGEFRVCSGSPRVRAGTSKEQRSHTRRPPLGQPHQKKTGENIIPESMFP